MYLLYTPTNITSTTIQYHSPDRYSALDQSGHPAHPGVEGFARLAEDPGTRYSVLDQLGHPTHPGVEGVARLAENSGTRYSAIYQSGHPTHPGVEAVARLAEDPYTIDFLFFFFGALSPLVLFSFSSFWIFSF